MADWRHRHLPSRHHILSHIPADPQRVSVCLHGRVSPGRRVSPVQRAHRLAVESWFEEKRIQRFTIFFQAPMLPLHGRVYL